MHRGPENSKKGPPKKTHEKKMYRIFFHWCNICHKIDFLERNLLIIIITQT